LSPNVIYRQSIRNEEFLHHLEHDVEQAQQRHMKAKTAKGMVRTALFLKPEQTQQLQTLNDLTGAPIAELIRRAIDDYLEKRKAELKGGR
jgi:hypothetical protein